MALPLAAQAQPVSGLYVGAGAGLNWRTDESGTYSARTVSTIGAPTTAAAGSTRTVTSVGAVGLGSIGWGFGNGLRAEVEGNYRYNEIRKTTLNNVRIGGHQGDYAIYGAMFNVLYDVNLGLPIVPYVGVGVGYGWTELNQASQLGFPRDRTKGELAYQGIVGAAYQLDSMVPGLALTLEGRYYGTLDPSFHEQNRINPTTSSQASYKPSNGNASLLLGVRYAFNAAPVAVMAPAVVAAPAVARTYLVFFDWDKANLTDRAKQIIAEAADASRKTGTTKIDVAGHADRSGTPAYNQRLSQRRADAVAAELVAKGVARTDIVITAFGESRPLVPTADGVREPQNRRVEIVLK
jgi:OmpA-OmpF porin, OOP family